MRRVLCGRLVLAVLLAAALPRFASADFINVISQTYHIHGFGGFQGTTSGRFLMTRLQALRYPELTVSLLVPVGSLEHTPW
jgi:hypothetical protein